MLFIRAISGVLGFICDIISLAFVAAVLTGVVQVVKGPYWGNFMQLIGH